MASLSNSTVSDLGSVQTFLSQREDPAFIGFNAGQIQQAESAIIGVSVVRTQAVPNMLQVQSQFFQINSKVTLGNNEYCMETVVLRESSGEDLTVPEVSVLNRQHNTLCEEPSAPTTQSDEDIS